MANPLVSVIIPAFNEEKVIGRLLNSIKKQSYKNIEIIVVDDASTDKTPLIAKRFTSKVFMQAHKERSVQRNFGAAKAQGEYFLFLDADMELQKNVIDECVIEIRSRLKTGAVTIPEVPVSYNFWGRVKAFERSFYNEEGDTNTDASRFFSKRAFIKAGGYDETITGPEDWDLPETIKKLGFRESRIRSKLYHYERVPNPIKLAQKKFYYGLTSYRYFEKHNIPAVGAKTIYFLRPVFYKNWRKLLIHPILTLALFVMLGCEQIGGGLGYLIGKIRRI